MLPHACQTSPRWLLNRACSSQDSLLPIGHYSPPRWIHSRFPFPFTPCNESISTAARFSWRIHPDTDYLSPFHCYQPAQRWLGSEHSPTRGSPCFLSWTPLQHILGPASREIYRPREITSSPFSLLSSGFSPLSLVPSPYHSPRTC